MFYTGYYGDIIYNGISWAFLSHCVASPGLSWALVKEKTHLARCLKQQENGVGFGWIWPTRPTKRGYFSIANQVVCIPLWIRGEKKSHQEPPLKIPCHPEGICHWSNGRTIGWTYLLSGIHPPDPCDLTFVLVRCVWKGGIRYPGMTKASWSADEYPGKRIRVVIKSYHVEMFIYANNLVAWFCSSATYLIWLNLTASTRYHHKWSFGWFLSGVWVIAISLRLIIQPEVGILGILTIVYFVCNQL